MRARPDDDTLVERPDPTQARAMLDEYFIISSSHAAISSTLPRTLDDEDIRQISDLLREQGSLCADTPRLYTILRLIDRLGDIETFTAQGINDLWLPLTTKTFPRNLGLDTRSLFFETQTRVLSGSLDLEKGERGLHRHYATIEDVPLISQGVLGRGSYAEVDLAKSKSTGTVYARKLIPRSRPGQIGDSRRNRQVMDDFEKEVKAFKHLSHRHIVKLVGSYTDPISMALLISPVADTDLRSFLETSHTSASKDLLYSFFGCLAAGLEYMHRMNVRHKDIKPANILVKGTCVLYADLGLAFCWEADGHSTTEDSFPIATRKYMPPECFDGGKRNSAADIWSLGCVFLEMVTVLHDSTLANLQEHLESYGTKSSIYGRNHDGAVTWLNQLKPKSLSDNKWVPVDVVKDMLKRLSLRRPSAQVVFERFSSLEERDIPLIGECCRPRSTTNTDGPFTPPVGGPSIAISAPAQSHDPDTRQTESEILPSNLDSLSFSSEASQERPVTPTRLDPAIPNATSGRQEASLLQPSNSQVKPKRVGRASLVRNTSLITAILQNDVTKARALIGEGADVNYQDFEGNTPLTRATMISNARLVSLFLENGADMQIVNKEGWTSFHYAVNSAGLDIINMMINRGVNIKQRNNLGGTPFVYATTNPKCDRRQLIHLLLSKGADPKETGLDGFTALHRAAYYGSDDVIELLVSLGININAMDNKLTSPLFNAAQQGRTSCVAKLLSLGALMEISRNDRLTPLMIAAVGGHTEVVEKLLESGANIHASNTYSNTAMTLAAAWGHVQVLELLLGTGRLNLNHRDNQGFSGLHWAAQNGKNLVVKALIEYGSEIDGRTLEGQTPLHLAVLKHLSDTVRVLLEYGADPLAVTKAGASAIDLAVKDGLVDVLHLLEDAIEEEDE